MAEKERLQNSIFIQPLAGKAGKTYQNTPKTRKLATDLTLIFSNGDRDTIIIMYTLSHRSQSHYISHINYVSSVICIKDSYLLSTS